MGGDDPRLPLDVALGDRLAERPALDLLADMGKIEQVLARHRRDADALLVLEHDEAGSAKPGERLAQRVDAAIVAIAELTQLQLLAGRQRYADDIGADLVDEQRCLGARAVGPAARHCRPIDRAALPLHRFPPGAPDFLERYHINFHRKSFFLLS